jgi:esterase FrsA
MLDAQFVGPALTEGAKPAIFYFSLSAKDSLFLDPFNQPVTALKNADVRIFSVTLPGHDHLPKETALNIWTAEILNPFIDEVCGYIEELIQKKIITTCGVMGLSRGVFIAAHVAARLTSVHALLGFAPLTKFHSMPAWDLDTLDDKLYTKTIRCYIGNRDTRVGTENAFFWLSELSNVAFEKGIRTSPIELIMTSSIGKDGHGTSPENFRAGAQWLFKQLEPS